MEKYQDLLAMQRPVHDGDPFARKHPSMPCSRRAKLFMPFAALRGFDESIVSMEEPYVPRPECTEEDEARLSCKLRILAERRPARRDGLRLQITYFVPHTQTLGRIVHAEGTLISFSVPRRRLELSTAAISFDQLLDIRSADGLFAAVPDP